MKHGWIHVRSKERPDPSKREKAISKEVSPCSEYTRYTVEGRMKDPESEMSVILDPRAIGPLFLSAPFNGPKWSKALGYGMAMIGEDTRVHLHLNGKYIIRRALDRDHALSSHRMLLEIARPALFSSSRNSYLWEDVRDMALDVEGFDREETGILITDPDIDIDRNSFLENARKGFLEAYERFGNVIDVLEPSDDPNELAIIEDEDGKLIDTYREHLTSIMDGDEKANGHLLGWSSFMSLVSNALFLELH